MRTDAEIVAHIREITDRDWLGTITADLAMYLPFEEARQFLSIGVDAGWTQLDRSPDTVKKQMLDYMDFAWGKANDCRGISAGRSLNHMAAWLWMLGEDQVATALESYMYYGKPQLRAICEHYGWDWRTWDDGEWRNEERSTVWSPDEVEVAGLH
jgi:hypothetical protein